MKAGPKHRPGVLVCPDDEAHGILILDTAGRLRCIHQEHDGRPAGHPLGASPRTAPVFTLDRVEEAGRARLAS